jgi:hypothetical protein
VRWAGQLDLAKLKKSAVPAAEIGAQKVIDAKAKARLEAAKRAGAAARAGGMSFGAGGWATSSQHSLKNPAPACQNSHPVRYKFNEGHTNAIRRPVLMRDLLA